MDPFLIQGLMVVGVLVCGLVAVIWGGLWILERLPIRTVVILVEFDWDASDDIRHC